MLRCASELTGDSRNQGGHAAPLAKKEARINVSIRLHLRVEKPCTFIMARPDTGLMPVVINRGCDLSRSPVVLTR